jgi:hypothetical protein
MAIVDLSGAKPPATLRWYDPGARAPSHRLPRVRALSYHQLTREADKLVQPAWVERGIGRPVARSVRRVRSLAPFLGTDRLHVGDGVFCEVLEPPSANVSVFAPVSLGSRGYHVLMMGGDSLPKTVTSFGAVNFVTGWCLFSNRAARLRSDRGSFSCLTPNAPPVDAPVGSIESSWELTLYELESALRLPWLTADMIALLPLEMPVTVTIDVPRVQYYLYLFDAFQRGFVAPELMLFWFDLVDERNSRVCDLLERELAAALSDVLPSRSVRVRRADGMGHLEPWIRDAVETRTPPEVAAIAGLLSADDALWSLAIGKTSPASYRDLINLSYVVEQLRGGTNCGSERPPLGIAIDNPSERRACARARAIAREVRGEGGNGRGMSLLGLHPLERAFTSEATGPSDLYYNDPGHAFVDPGGCRYGTAELLATLYPDRSTPPREAASASPEVSEPACSLAHLMRAGCVGRDHAGVAPPIRCPSASSATLTTERRDS